MRRTIDGIILDKSFISSQPKKVIRVFQDTVNHIIQQSLFTSDISRLYFAPFKRQTNQSRSSADIHPTVREPIHTKNIIYRFMQQRFERDHLIFLRLPVKSHKATPTATQPQNRIPFGYHGKECVYFVLFIKEMIILPFLDANPTGSFVQCHLAKSAIGSCQIENRIIGFMNGMYFHVMPAYSINHLSEAIILK